MNGNQETQDDLDLTHYLEVLMRRRWIVLATLCIVFIAALLKTFTTTPVYQASTLLVIEKERNSGGALYAGNAFIESSNDDYYQTQYKLLNSESLTQKVFDDLDLGKYPDFADPGGVRKLRGAIKIAPVLRSRLVYVHILSHDANLAALVANGLAKTFVNQNLANQLFISKEVLQALQINEDSPKARRTYDALPAVVNNPLIQTLKGEYAKLQSQYAEMSQRFTPKYPAMIALKSNMTALSGQIQAETDKIVQSLKTELSGQLRGNNVRIIDPAQRPEHPVSPKKQRNIVLGFLGGLALGIGLAFLIETIDQTVRTQEDVEEKLRLPFLGMVPLSADKGPSVYSPLLSKEVSLTSDGMRNLRTMIDFAGVSQKAKSFLVTSAVQGEGKTYVASNLAVVFAQLGESVLLISGDLRRPQVAKNFAVSTERGLCDFLVGGKEASEVGGLLQTCDVPNLKILPCGPRPPNPSELLNTPRVGAMLAWARTNFDRVIIDCTPMFPINDTLLWGRHVPSAVIVVSYGKTRTPLIRNATQKMQSGGGNILGMVVNRATPGGLAYASYGYYYHQYYHAYHREPAAAKHS